MAKVTNIRLPDALLSSNDYRALDADQRSSFMARIAHCMEIAAAGEIAALRMEGGFLSAVDDMSLMRSRF